MSLTAREAAGIFIMCCALPCIPTTIWLIKRRHFYPLAGRLVWLMVSLNFAFFTYPISHGLAVFYGLDYPCAILYWSNTLLYGSMVVFCVIRLAICLFSFELQKEMATYQSKVAANALTRTGKIKATELASTASPELGWFTKRYRWLEVRNLVKAMIVLLLIFLIPSAIVTAVDPAMKTSVYCSEAFIVPRNYSILATSCVGSVFAFYLFLRIKKHGNDGLFILGEMRFQVLIGVPVNWVYIILQPFSEPPDFPYAAVVFHIVLVGLHFVCSAWPTYLTYITVNPADQKYTLAEVVASESGYAAFLDFCQREFSSENLLCWKVIDDYRNGFDAMTHQERLAMMVSIRDTYFNQDAVFQVNMADEIRMAVVQQVNKLEVGGADAVSSDNSSHIVNVDEERKVVAPQPQPKTPTASSRSLSRLSVLTTDRRSSTPDPQSIYLQQLKTVFDEAQQSLLRLMEADTFIRFKASPIFGTWHKELSHSTPSATQPQPPSPTVSPRTPTV